MRRVIALAIIRSEWAEHGRDTQQSIRAFVENRVSKQSRDKAAEEGRAIYHHNCATDAAHQIEEVRKFEEAGDLIESMILDSYKRQGGIYKRVAEEYENEGKLYKQAVKELEEKLE